MNGYHPPIVELIASGRWPEDCVNAQWAARSSWKSPDAVRQAEIDAAWSAAQARAGSAALYDGPLCRLESHHIVGDALHLWLSATSYRLFVGTNMLHSDQAGSIDPGTLANPLGLSAALISADEWLVFGRRNDGVAYYPNRIHPFAGSLESRDALASSINVFDGIRRELNEELSITRDGLTSLACIGLAKDCRLRQPELIFEARTTASCDELAGMVDVAEHGGLWSASLNEDDLSAALHEPLLTPIAVATILLLGKLRFGAQWCARHAQLFASVETQAPS